MILCTVSILLACLGGYGWITPIEPEDLRQEAKIRGEGELLTLDAFYRAITPKAEPDTNYAGRLARAVNGRLVRAWDVDRLKVTAIDDPSTVDYIVGVYGPGGNRIFSDACDYFGRRICWIGHASYLGLWLLPAGLLFCAAWLRLGKHSEDSAIAHVTDRVRR